MGRRSVHRCSLLKSIPSCGHCRLRRGRVSLAGQVYFITVCAKNRRPVFGEVRAARAVAQALHGIALGRAQRMIAWVVMPDHVHLLIRLQGEETLPAVMNRINSCTAKAVNRVIGARGPVWQGAYHDRALRDERDFLPAARYLLANPIRAGLVAGLGAYPYWNAYEFGMEDLLAG